MSSTDALYLAFLVTGFTVGLGHCIGMCGPIVVSLSLNLKERNPLLPHLLYNTGRVITYAILGGVAGTLGSFTILTSSIVSLQKGVLISAGARIGGQVHGGLYPLPIFTRGDLCTDHSHGLAAQQLVQIGLHNDRGDANIGKH